MGTTNLFVELVVIGVGAVAWVAPATLALAGLDALPADWLQAPAAALPALALVYVLGIVTDRLADAAFERVWTDDLRGEWFASRAEYYAARRAVLTGSARLSELLEYGRSRLRICRGWAFNLALAALAWNALCWTRLRGEPHAARAAWAGGAALLLVAAGAWFAWRQLTRSEYRKIREQAAWLAERDAD